MYGQIEVMARLSYLRSERAADKAGSIGMAIPGVERRVLDERARGLPPARSGNSQRVART
jgi:long-chain acyl-CoA synthetase